MVNASTSRKAGTTDGILRYHDDSGRQNSTLASQTMSMYEDPSGWKPIPPWCLKYVDDVNGGERHFLKNGVSTFSHMKERKDLRAVGCEELFAAIAHYAKAYGMRVNAAKTQLLCLSAAVNSEVTSHAFLGEKKTLIKSADSLTILGFMFGCKPSVAAHMDLIKQKYHARAWLLRHLKAAGCRSRTY